MLLDFVERLDCVKIIYVKYLLSFPILVKLREITISENILYCNILVNSDNSTYSTIQSYTVNITILESCFFLVILVSVE